MQAQSVSRFSDAVLSLVPVVVAVASLLIDSLLDNGLLIISKHNYYQYIFCGEFKIQKVSK